MGEPREILHKVPASNMSTFIFMWVAYFMSFVFCMLAVREILPPEGLRPVLAKLCNCRTECARLQLWFAAWRDKAGGGGSDANETSAAAVAAADRAISQEIWLFITGSTSRGRMKTGVQ